MVQPGCTVHGYEQGGVRRQRDRDGCCGKSGSPRRRTLRGRIDVRTLDTFAPDGQAQVGYPDGAVHRIVSDLSAFIGSHDTATHRILAAGDLKRLVPKL